MKKFLSLTLLLLLLFSLIPSAVSAKSTTVKVQNVPNDAVGVDVLFTNSSNVGVCTKTGPNWDWSDGGEYITSDLGGITVHWSGGATTTIPVSELTVVSEGHGTLVLRVKGDITPPKKYTVTYQYTGTVPPGAPALPATQSYTAGTEVSVAAVPALAGYTFTGWATADATVVGGKFSMPAKNVTITGYFTAIPPTFYTVTYQYTGTVPPGAPALPTTQSYTAGTEVSVAAVPALAGYTFTGWTTADATVAGGKFSMPAKNVTITGYFTKNECPTQYNVTYQYTGTVPPGAPALPTTQSYTAGTEVSVAAVPALSGYSFTGWATTDASVVGGKFSMPAKNVTITGYFTAIPPTCYTVTYQYTGTVPPGAPALPTTQSYTAGTEVSVAAVPALAGYTFAGWATTDATVANGKFTMPSNNVVHVGYYTKIPVRDKTPDTGDSTPLELIAAAGTACLGVCLYCLLSARKKKKSGK